jgi:4-amino-4-deoxy-L-arabinose transferase-like glycosyltransferase
VTLFVISAATFAARAPALLISSIDWDEGVYIVTAQQWLLGGLPYVAVWDQHPPGLPALLALVQNIIPDPVFGARLAAALAVMMTALLIHRFCVRYVNRPRAGLIGALLYIVCISRWVGLSANTEVFNNACVTFAAYLLYGASRRSPTGLPRAVAAAAMLGVGLQIKYVVFPEAVLFCLGYLMVSYQRSGDLCATIVAGELLVLAGCLPTGIAILYFWANGALQPFLDANIRSNIAYLEAVPSFFAIIKNSASGIAPVMGAILMIGYAMARRLQSHRILNTASSIKAGILLWGAAAIADVCLPLKFPVHYYFALYPPLCLAGALALSDMAGNRRKAFAAGLVALFGVAVPLWGLGEVRAARASKADAPRAVAAFLRQVGAGDTSVFVYDYQAVVYALARILPPTPYVLGAELAQFTYSSGVDGAAEVRRVMDKSPEYVVVRVRLPGELVPVALDAVIVPRLAAYHVAFQTSDGADESEIRVYRR